MPTIISGEIEGKAATLNNPLPTYTSVIDENGVKSKILGDTIFQGAPIVITPEHHEIHCGDSYTAHRIVDLANGASDNVLITVPNETGTGQSQKLYHLNVRGSNEGEVIWYMYEAPTTTDNCTAIANYNRNRNSSNTTGLTTYHTPTITDDGTLILVAHSGSGKGVGGDRKSEEIVLKNNTKYLLRCTNQTALANYITWQLDHYIHPGI